MRAADLCAPLAILHDCIGRFLSLVLAHTHTHTHTHTHVLSPPSIRRRSALASTQHALVPLLDAHVPSVARCACPDGMEVDEYMFVILQLLGLVH